MQQYQVPHFIKPAAAPGGRTTRNRGTYFPGMLHGTRFRTALRVSVLLPLAWIWL